MEVFKFIEGRSHNRRVNIIVVKDESGEFIITVETKRLINFKEREILHYKIQYSLYTFIVLCEFMRNIVNDTEFKRATNDLIATFEKTMNVKTNMDRMT